MEDGTSEPTITKSPKAPKASKGLRRVCYFTNWSQYRPGAKFLPEHIDVALCTHLVYAFAKLDGTQLVASEWNDEGTVERRGMYQRFNDLKLQSKVKTLLAVGGWNTGSAPFTSMVAVAQSRREFAQQSLAFIKKHGFDGLDLDWVYPANLGSPAGDRERFTLLVKQLRKTFDKDAKECGGRTWLLTAAVGAGKEVIDSGYDVPAIAPCFDFISLMAYDFHGKWEGVTGHHSALFAHDGETGEQRYLNVDWAAQYWMQMGCPREKLVIGIPMFARTFKLRSPSANALGAPVLDAGVAGTYTREKGLLAYYEVYQLHKMAEVRDRIEAQRVPYLVKRDQWVAYEDIDSVREKARYVKVNGYGGVMMWCLDLDDFSGTLCGQGKYPLWSAVTAELLA